MDYHNWLRSIANCIAIIGILVIITGVLACQNYHPILNFFQPVNCEMGYIGLAIFLLGIGMGEWGSNVLSRQK